MKSLAHMMIWGAVAALTMLGCERHEFDQTKILHGDHGHHDEHHGDDHGHGDKGHHKGDHGHKDEHKHDDHEKKSDHGHKEEKKPTEKAGDARDVGL